ELLPAAVAFNISLFAAGMASICLQVYLVVELAIWQARFQASRFALLKSISTIGGLLGGLFLIKVVHVAGAGAVAWGMVFGNGVAVVIGSRGLSACWRFSNVDRKTVSRVVRFGLPLSGWFLGSYVLTLADKTVLAWAAPLSVVGAYGAVYSMATGVASLLITPLVMSTHPAVAAAWAEGSRHRASVVA